MNDTEAIMALAFEYRHAIDDRGTKYRALRTAIEQLTQQLADASLIAAAPELLEVLKELAALDFGARGDTRRIDFVARRARAAIAKAEGKP